MHEIRKSFTVFVIMLGFRMINCSYIIEKKT